MNHHDITKILLKVAFNTINQTKPITTNIVRWNPAHCNGVLDTTWCDMVCRWLAAGWNFTPERYIAGILLKIVLKHHGSNPDPIFVFKYGYQDLCRFLRNKINITVIGLALVH